MRRIAIYTLLITLMVSSCGPIETNLDSTEKIDSSYVFTKSKTVMEEKEILELEGNIQTDEAFVFSPEVTYAPQYTCPNCGELFDGRECENCHYIENR